MLVYMGQHILKYIYIYIYTHTYIFINTLIRIHIYIYKIIYFAEHEIQCIHVRMAE